MANNPSAKKRIRQNEKRRLHNRMIRGQVRSTVKRFYAMAHDSTIGVEQLQEKFKQVQKLVDTASGKGVYHRNTVARIKSRLMFIINTHK